MCPLHNRGTWIKQVSKIPVSNQPSLFFINVWKSLESCEATGKSVMEKTASPSNLSLYFLFRNKSLQNPTNFYYRKIQTGIMTTSLKAFFLPLKSLSEKIKLHIQLDKYLGLQRRRWKWNHSWGIHGFCVKGQSAVFQLLLTKI